MPYNVGSKVSRRSFQRDIKHLPTGQDVSNVRDGIFRHEKNDKPHGTGDIVRHGRKNLLPSQGNTRQKRSTSLSTSIFRHDFLTGRYPTIFQEDSPPCPVGVVNLVGENVGQELRRRLSPSQVTLIKGLPLQKSLQGFSV